MSSGVGHKDKKSMEHPLITGGGTTIRRYRIGKYNGVLVQDPNSFGPIKYRYVMTVFSEQGEDPIMFVTAEQNEMQAELFKITRENLNDPSLEYDASSYFLGVFDGSGRRNLGSSPDWGQWQKFERRALAIIKAELGIKETTRATAASSSPPKPPSHGSSPVPTSERSSSELSADTSLLHQLGALTVSLVIFFLAWLTVSLLLTALDQARGLGSDWVQTLFRDVLAPWVGGYAGVAAGLRWLRRSSAKFVFFGFSAAVLLIVGAYLGFVGGVRVQADISVASYLWGAVSLVASIFGAYKAARDEGLHL